MNNTLTTSVSGLHHQAGTPVLVRKDVYANFGLGQLDTGTLIKSFLASAALVLLIGVILLGTWVTQRSTDAILQHSAHSVAMVMDSAIEPLVQELADQPQLSSYSIEAIDNLLTHRAVVEKLSGIMIWRRDGVIAYARDRDLIGRAQPMTKELNAALDGKVEMEQLSTPNSLSTLDPANAQDSYKIYSPMHQLGTSDVIAVAVYIEPPHQFDSLLAKGRRDTWVIMGFFTFLIFGFTLNFIHRASQMIRGQNNDLRNRYSAQVQLNLQNELLQKQLQDAHRAGLEIKESFLRRISADLHDGPAQFLALALLRVDDITPVTAVAAPGANDPETMRRLKALETVRSATQNALKEIRSISTGLALPELEDHSPTEAIGVAVSTFVSATNANVACNLYNLPDRLPMAWTVCLFRFVQEGLSNAFRHAGAQGLEVRASRRNEDFVIEISDRGPGFDMLQSCSKTRLGLVGLRHRIEVLGGNFEINSKPGHGTMIAMAIPLNEFDN